MAKARVTYGFGGKPTYQTAFGDYRGNTSIPARGGTATKVPRSASSPAPTIHASVPTMASAPAPATPPAPPAAVAPFLSADDLQAINDFTTSYATGLQNIDFELGNLGTDTQYQETQVNQAAKQQTAQTADTMAARGLFRSSIKDAALYDIEANRALQTKFLDDKLTAATLNAGTQKNILAQSKSRFDTALAQKQVENAQAANDSQNQGYQALLEGFYAAHPELRPANGKSPAAQPSAAAPWKPPAAPKPPATPKPKSPTPPRVTYSLGGGPTYHTAFGNFKGRF